MRTRIILIVILLIYATGAIASGKWSPDNIRDPYTYDRPRYVVDYLEYINLDERDELNILCQKIDDEFGLSPAIVVLDDIGHDIYGFANQLFNNWEVSYGNHGFLVLINAKQREWCVVSNSTIYNDETLTNIASSTIETYTRQDKISDGLQLFLTQLHHLATKTHEKEGSRHTPKIGIDHAMSSASNDHNGYGSTIGEEIDYGWDRNGHEEWKPENLVDPFTIDSTYYVCDPLRYLTVWQRRSLDSICDVLNHRADIETAIVILDHITQDTFDFGLSLYNRWGLGRQDRGLLVLIVIDDHNWQFNTGYGVEGIFPDALLSNVGESKLVPEFRNGHYYEGIRDMLGELYNIAVVDGYGKTYYSSNSNYDDDELTIEDITAFILFIIILIGANNCINHNKRKSLKDIKASYEIRQNNMSTIYYKSNIEESDKWSLWSKHGWLRFMLINFPFIVMVFSVNEQSQEMFNFVNILPVLYPYFIYQCLIWFIVAGILIHSDKSHASIVARAQAVTNSSTAKIYKYIVPFIAFPAIKIIKYTILHHTNKAITCPKCQRELTPLPKQYICDNSARHCEIEHQITSPAFYTCSASHIITVINHGPNYNQYADCKACGGHTLKRTASRTKVAATYTTEGTKEVDYLCISCGHSETVLEAIPKLKPISSGSYSSSSGGSYRSYSSSGGSRGGGRSGGGGARGRW